MDIYFCDLCGSRVTSVDLRGGIGMHHGDDAICGRCVEMGRGQDWLAGHQSEVLPEKPPASPVSTIDRARDRARTIDKDLAGEPVRPQVIRSVDSDEQPMQPIALTPEPVVSLDVPSQVPPRAAVPPMVEAAPLSVADDQQGNPDADGAASGDGHEITTKLPPANVDYAEAASTFSALGSSHAVRPSDNQADDLQDQPEPPERITDNVRKPPAVKYKAGPITETAMAPTPTPTPTPKKRATASSKYSSSRSNGGNARTPSSRINDTSRSNGGNARTPSSRINDTSRSNGGNARTPSSRINDTNGRNGKSARTPNVSGRPSTKKTAAYNKKATNAVWGFTIVAVIASIILLVLASTASSRRRAPDGSDGQVSFNLTQAVTEEVQTAYSKAQAALNKSPLVETELRGALDAIHTIRRKLEDFGNKAKSIGHWTDEQVALKLEEIGAPRTFSLVRNINEALVRMQNDRTMR
jgi:hypothetical protein